MKTKGLLYFFLVSILFLYLTCEVEGKRGGGGSRGGSHGSWSGGSSKSKSSSSYGSSDYGSSGYGSRTYQGKSYAGGYGNTWGPGASSWDTTSGLNKFGSNDRWGYSGGHRFYYVGYYPIGFGGYGGYGYSGYGYGHHHHNGSRGNDLDYGWKPMSPWTVMFLVWLGLFTAGFLAWLIIYCIYKNYEDYEDI